MAEETLRLVVNLYVDIKENMAVFLLQNTVSVHQENKLLISNYTFIKSSTVSAKVGIDCIGSFFVLAFSIPSVPYQFFSRIRPETNIKYKARTKFNNDAPVILVVRSRPKIKHMLMLKF